MPVTTTENENSVQFKLDDEESATVRDITKVDALATACKVIIRKAIEAYKEEAK